MKHTKQEPGSFWHQFDHPQKNPLVVKASPNSRHIQSLVSHLTKDHPKNTENRFTPKLNKPTTKSSINFLKKTHKPFQSKPKSKFDLKSCYKCEQKGHTSFLQNPIETPWITNWWRHQPYPKSLQWSHRDRPVFSGTSEEEFWIDELTTSSSNSDISSNSKQVNVLNQDQEFILKSIKRLDPQLQKNIPRQAIE